MRSRGLTEAQVIGLRGFLRELSWKQKSNVVARKTSDSQAFKTRFRQKHPPFKNADEDPEEIQQGQRDDHPRTQVRQGRNDPAEVGPSDKKAQKNNRNDYLQGGDTYTSEHSSFQPEWT